MKEYKLLTPGPLTTTDTVKREMLFDHCTWDGDYKNITQEIRKRLLALGQVSEDEYTTVLMQGSGTFGVESVLSTAVPRDGKILICTNGAYGERMVEIARCQGLSWVHYEENYSQVISAEKVEALLRENPDVTHVAMVHCETTTGILNPAEPVGRLCQKMGKVFILDAMSSFGGIPVLVKAWGIDYLVSSANKCIQGVPGFSFILARRSQLEKTEGQARSLSLDLYGQWREMEKDGKWRYTSPTHAVLAFLRALEELDMEGGVEARHRRYRRNNQALIAGMKELGFAPYVEAEYQSPIITTFVYPDSGRFSFEEMYHYVKERGYAIYPGKLTKAATFRLGNIGEIYLEDILNICNIFKRFLEERAA